MIASRSSRGRELKSSLQASIVPGWLGSAPSVGIRMNIDLVSPRRERSCACVLNSSPSRSRPVENLERLAGEMPLAYMRARKAFTHSGTPSSVLASTVTFGVGVLRRVSTAEGTHP